MHNRPLMRLCPSFAHQSLPHQRDTVPALFWTFLDYQGQACCLHLEPCCPSVGVLTLLRVMHTLGQRYTAVPPHPKHHHHSHWLHYSTVIDQPPQRLPTWVVEYSRSVKRQPRFYWIWGHPFCGICQLHCVLGSLIHRECGASCKKERARTGVVVFRTLSARTDTPTS